MKVLLQLLSSYALFTVAVLGADISGKWSAQIPGRDGQSREVIYHFKADGAKLSGTMSGPQGADVPLSDGKIDGERISFSVKLEFNGNSMVRNFSGIVSGDEIKMRSQTQRGAQEFVAKRAK